MALEMTEAEQTDFFTPRREVLRLPFQSPRFEAAAAVPDTHEYMYAKILEFAARHPETDGELMVYPEGNPAFPLPGELAIGGLTLYGSYRAARTMPRSGDMLSVDVSHDPSAGVIVAEVEKQRNDSRFFDTERLRMRVGYDGGIEPMYDRFAESLPPIIAEDILLGLGSDAHVS
jgi:hypothetical protein